MGDFWRGAEAESGPGMLIRKKLLSECSCVVGIGGVVARYRPCASTRWFVDMSQPTRRQIDFRRRWESRGISYDDGIVRGQGSSSSLRLYSISYPLPSSQTWNFLSTQRQKVGCSYPGNTESTQTSQSKIQVLGYMLCLEDHSSPTGVLTATSGKPGDGHVNPKATLADSSPR